MAKITDVESNKKLFTNNMTLMIGGFLGVGEPQKLIDQVVESNVKNLTVIAVAGEYPGGGGVGIGKLSENKQIKRFITSHIGTDPSMVAQYNSGELVVEFNPMGTWIERIRCGGGGLGGVLTPTGFGTEVEDGREKITVEGKEYLLFPPLRADIAIIKAHKADKAGNLLYKGLSINSNPVIATAADYVIAEVDEIVDIGEIPYNQIGTPGIYVDAVVKGYEIEERKEILQRLWVKTKKLNKEV